jgi:hypothetical protein
MKALTVIALGGLLAACGGGGGDAGGNQSAGGDTPPAAAPLGTGTVSGTISFTGTAPANPSIDMSEEAACRDKHQGGVTDPQYVVNDGKLGNVFVYVKSGLPAGATFTSPSEPVVIDQNGCLYHPRVLGIMVGQPLEIRNSDPVLHNIKAVPAANRGFNISQPTEGMKTTRTFDTPEVMVPLECNVHGWMNAYVGVMSHPYFAVSSENGTYSITGLPAGTYEIEAWHEKLGTKTMTVTVPDGGGATADFSFAPTA